MGQIQSGLRSAVRIAQGGHVSFFILFSMGSVLNFNIFNIFVQIRIRNFTEMPMQVDGEPWIQTPGELVILKSALKVLLSVYNTKLINFYTKIFIFKATMLRKSKMKRRNTEPSLAGGPESSRTRIPIDEERSSIAEAD